MTPWSARLQLLARVVLGAALSHYAPVKAIQVPTIVLCAAAAIATACDKEPEAPAPVATASPQLVPSAVPQAQVPHAKPTQAGHPGGSTELAITWEDPAGWQRLPKQNAMRKATYAVPKADGDSEDAELAVFYFGPNSGGGIEPNVERWIGQFSGITDQDVRRSERDTGGPTQHLVEIKRGTFASGMPGGSAVQKKGFGLLAAIVETSSGHYFFKMTGPGATVEKARPDFLALLDSIKTTK